MVAFHNDPRVLKKDIEELTKLVAAFKAENENMRQIIDNLELQIAVGARLLETAVDPFAHRDPFLVTQDGTRIRRAK